MTRYVTVEQPDLVAAPPARTFRLQVTAVPVAKPRPRVGNGRVYTPTNARQAEWEIAQAWERRYPGQAPLMGAVELEVVVFIVQPASIPKFRRQTARPVTRPDADNYAKTVLDALNSVAYRDDAQVVRLVVEKRYAVGVAPHWEIELTGLEVER